MASSERFGYEWQKYSFLAPAYEEQFRAWIAPLTPLDFKNKTVLDAGCGMGRNSFWALEYGAREALAFDLDERSVESARKNLQEFYTAGVEQHSIYDINWRERFDIVMCIGVLHHLENPKSALINLFKALRPGGKLVLWVYSFEGNERLLTWLDPLRRYLTSKLPVSLVHAIAYLFSVPLWLYVHLFRSKDEYLGRLRGFDFWHVHSIVFDQLIPRVANYWRQSEVSNLVESAGIANFLIHNPPHGTGWTLIARKL